MPKPNTPDRNFQVGGTHYTSMDIQPWDIIDQWPIHEQVGFYRGNALKYLLRFGAKASHDAGAPAADAKKAHHYMGKLISVLDPDNCMRSDAETDADEVEVEVQHFTSEQLLQWLLKHASADEGDF